VGQCTGTASTLVTKPRGGALTRGGPEHSSDEEVIEDADVGAVCRRGLGSMWDARYNGWVGGEVV
jgi:hypothetical protein